MGYAAVSILLRPWKPSDFHDFEEDKHCQRLRQVFRGRCKTSKVFFLLVLFTASYATSRKQQSVPLFSGVASCRLHLG
jgi:hypothetical protein